MGPTTKREPARSHDVAGWRQGLLLGAGFDPYLAAGLALDARVDLHALLQLVDLGCPPLLAARVLAPLDRDQLGT
jgi:hypothetical protein